MSIDERRGVKINDRLVLKTGEVVEVMDPECTWCADTRAFAFRVRLAPPHHWDGVGYFEIREEQVDFAQTRRRFAKLNGWVSADGKEFDEYELHRLKYAMLLDEEFRHAQFCSPHGEKFWQLPLRQQIERWIEQLPSSERERHGV